MVTMPSASSKSSVQPNNTEAGDPWTQALSIVDRKVRNLEKRKVKLDSYKKLVDDGKELNEDQKSAVGQRDAVDKLLEFSKELQRQFTQLNIEFMKNQKKQAKRELILVQAAKHDSDTNLVKKILDLQQLLDGISDEVKADFLEGTNGAVQLSEADLNHIDEFYKVITPSQDDEDHPKVNVKTAAEHIVDLFEATNKQFGTTTYKALHELVTKIQMCGYFGQQNTSKEAEETMTVEEEDKAETDSSSSGQEQTGGNVIEGFTSEPTEPSREQVSPPTLEEIPVEVDVNGINGDEAPEETAEDVGTPEQAADVMTLTNDLGLNFLGESEVEGPAVALTGEVSDFTEAAPEKPSQDEEQNVDESGWTQAGSHENTQADQGSSSRGGRGGNSWRGGRPPRGGGFRGRDRGRGGSGPRGGGPQVNGSRPDGGYRRGPLNGRGGNRGGPRGGMNSNRRGGYGGPPPNKQ